MTANNLVGPNGQFPDLKLFGRDPRIVRLDQSDFIEKPVGARLIGEVFRAVCEQDVSVDAVPVPGLGAGELIKIGFGELRLRCHAVPLRFE